MRDRHGQKQTLASETGFKVQNSAALFSNGSLWKGAGVKLKNFASIEGYQAFKFHSAVHREKDTIFGDYFPAWASNPGLVIPCYWIYISDVCYTATPAGNLQLCSPTLFNATDQ